jgi:hypothetical protein
LLKHNDSKHLHSSMHLQKLDGCPNNTRPNESVIIVIKAGRYEKLKP